MGYSLFFLLYGFIICLAYGFSFYLYLLLELAVEKKKEVPDWFYRIGQSMQDRFHRVKLENSTNYIFPVFFKNFLYLKSCITDIIIIPSNKLINENATYSIAQSSSCVSILYSARITNPTHIIRTTVNEPIISPYNHH